jgi:hypothetical protein
MAGGVVVEEDSGGGGIMMSSNPMTANELTAELLIQIPKRFPQARVWRNNRVDAWVQNKEGPRRRIKAGIDGQGDITGIFPVQVGTILAGWRLEIEVKIGKDCQSVQQKAFQQAMEKAGGIYIVARSVEQSLEDLARWA